MVHMVVIHVSLICFLSIRRLQCARITQTSKLSNYHINAIINVIKGLSGHGKLFQQRCYIKDKREIERYREWRSIDSREGNGMEEKKNITGKGIASVRSVG